MALVEVRRYSDILDKRVGLQLILPEVGQPPYPVLFLLHGLSDDYTGWVRKSRLEHHLRETPLIVVMPDGFRSWYTRHHRGPDYATYLAVETVDYVDRFFATRPDGSHRAIAGLSMGGYGALLALAQHPQRFASCSSHSGALRPWARQPKIWSDVELENVFGPDPEASSHNLFAQDFFQHRWGPHRTALRLDCGVADLPWIGHNRDFHQLLESCGVEHQYLELQGGHDWDYWEARCPELIEFHMAALRNASSLARP